MKWVFIFLLLLNVGYFVFEFDQQLAQPKPEAVVADSIPAGIERLRLVRELEEAPRIRSMGEPDGADSALGELREEELTAELVGTIGEQVSELVDVEANADSELGEPVVVARVETEADQEAVPADTATDSETSIETEVETEPADDGALGRCFTVGPFKDESAGSALVSWFEQQSAEVASRNETTRKRLFWVYHEPLESAAAARATVQEMVGKGVQDLMLISGGDMANAISLGVFSTQEAVNRRLEEMRDQGYEPVVVPQYRDREELWLDVQSPFDELIARKDLPELSQGVTVVNRSCDEIAKLETAP